MGHISIRLSGGDVSPSKIRSKEIAKLIDAIEDMIASYIVHFNPTVPKEAVVVGLAGLTDKSIGLQFAPNLTEFTIPAVRNIIESLKKLDFSGIPGGTVNGLKVIRGFTSRHNCEAELSVHGKDTENTDAGAVAFITPETKIVTKTPLEGETVLYGEVVRVGGETPRVRIRTMSGSFVNCTVSAEIAKKIAGRLYTEVGLRGDAVWNPDTLGMEKFHIHSLTDYSETPIDEAFKELRENFGHIYDKIPDIENLMTEIRRGD